VQEVLQQKLQREQQLRATWDAALDRRQEAELELDALAYRLDELASQRAVLENQLASELAADSEFQRLSKLALDAERELESNEQRVSESRQDAAEKLPQYEASRLFKYLVGKNYGTPGYKSRGLTRVLDRWVARLVHFADNKQSYDFLRITPKLMAAEVARRRDDFSSLMQQLERIEDAVSDKIGLTDVLVKGEKFANDRDRLVDLLAELAKQREQLEGELQSLESRDNEYYREGISRLRQYLASLHDAALAAKAEATLDPVDDQLVAEIAQVSDQVARAQQQIAELQHDQGRWNERLVGLDYVVQLFRRADFDSGRSFFSRRANLASEVNAYLDGRQSKDDLWNTIRRSQKFVQPQWSTESWDDFGNLIDSDVSHVLMNVLLQTAGEALQRSARRGVSRRGSQRRSQRKSTGRPPIHRGRRGGFTTGGGF
jgi:hypothetical protein